MTGWFFLLGFLAAIASPFFVLALRNGLVAGHEDVLADIGFFSGVFALPALLAGLVTLSIISAMRLGWRWSSALAASLVASFVMALPLLGA